MTTDYIFKIVLVGDMSVGKTSLLLRFTEGTFNHNQKNTIGVDFLFKEVDMGQHGTAKLSIWDTSGQERFRAIVANFYRGSDGFVVVYDITDPSSFNHVTRWFKEANHHGLSTASCSCLLIGNKSDLEHERAVPFEDGHRLADRMGVPFLETSALAATNVNQAFVSLAHSILETKTGNPMVPDYSGPASFTVTESKAVGEEGYFNYYCCSYY